jgi:hypothetical protein
VDVRLVKRYFLIGLFFGCSSNFVPGGKENTK